MRNANPEFDSLVERAKTNNRYRRELKKHISNFALMVNQVKENGEG